MYSNKVMKQCDRMSSPSFRVVKEVKDEVLH